ncbi:hypothetical protein EDB89DRAFT_1942234, partial [Lactarius sanguifluus]
MSTLDSLPLILSPVVATRTHSHPAHITRRSAKRAHFALFDATAKTFRTQDSRLRLITSRSHTTPRFVSPSTIARTFAGSRSFVSARATSESFPPFTLASTLRYFHSFRLRTRTRYHGTPGFATLQLSDNRYPPTQVPGQARHQRHSDQQPQCLKLRRVHASAPTRAVHAPRLTLRIRPRRPVFKFKRSVSAHEDIRQRKSKTRIGFITARRATLLAP